jgi:hypothetical protein
MCIMIMYFLICYICVGYIVFWAGSRACWHTCCNKTFIIPGTVFG